MSPLKCSMVAGFYKISLLAIFDIYTGMTGKQFYIRACSFGRKH